MARLSDMLEDEDSVSSMSSKSTGCCIPALLLKASIDAKLTHLVQPDKTLALHTAMGIFYEEIGDPLDKFIETYMGLFPLTIVTQGSSKILSPISYFTNLYNQIEIERKGIKESFLQSQIDSFQELITHTLYRLKYIQD